MKNILLIIGLFLSVTLFGQDIVKIKHTNYTTHYSKSKNYPVLVEWWVTKKMVTCPSPLKRKDVFAPDPNLAKETDLADDYKGSGYDRGHMMPAADNLCQTQKVQDECFYFSNMAAQTHTLNAGIWKTLETKTREIAANDDSTYVWCGNMGEIKKIGKVSVPEKCYKVLYNKKKNVYYYYIFDNNNEKLGDLTKYEVTKAEIEKKTGLKFKK